MEKLICNNMTAVLISPGYGAGWSTWFHYENDDLNKQAVFDPELAQAVLDKPQDSSQKEFNLWLTYIKEICQRKYPDQYTGGVGDLEVRWVPVGARFRIHEYDGHESVEIYDPNSYMTA